MVMDITNVNANLSSLVADEKSGRLTAHSPSIPPVEKLNQPADLSQRNTTTDSQKDDDSATKQPKLSDIQSQVQSLQDASQKKGWSVNFSIDDAADKTIIKVIDADTQKVIKQIPSEELLSITKRIKAMQDGEGSGSDLSGLLLDRKA